MEIDEAEKMVVARLRRNGGRTKQHHDVGDSHVRVIRRFQPWMATFRDLWNDEREKTKEASHAWLGCSNGWPNHGAGGDSREEERA